MSNYHLILNTYYMNETKFKKIELKDRLYQRRYVIPNAVTVGNLFCGFLSIIYSSSGRYEKAIIAIIIAILLDGLDGRVARKLNATSNFGVEFDSFSDLISFGLAPALLMYNWCFRVIADEFGVFVCFVYALCAACRLVRFNISTVNLSSFEGLASPAAAALVAAVVNLDVRSEPSVLGVTTGTLLLLSAAYLMVSKIPYRSIKKIKLDNLGVFGMIGIGALIASIWYSPKIGFVAVAMGYAMSGLILKIFYKEKSLENKSLVG
jgi:CDP-diacylglycerol--serine O-phosphatidyltransferase